MDDAEKSQHASNKLVYKVSCADKPFIESLLSQPHVWNYALQTDTHRDIGQRSVLQVSHIM